MFRLKRIIREQKAFTLIELIAVVAILGVLAAIVIPRVMDSVDKADLTAIKATQKTLQTATELYRVEKGKYPNNLSELVASDYIDEVPDFDKLGVEFSIDTNGKITYE